MAHKVYLDNNATTKVDEKVVHEMLPFLTERYGNASSMHEFGKEADQAIDDAREIVAHALGGSQREIFFTSGGTEADNLAIIGYCLANRDKGDQIITQRTEHSAVLNAFEHLRSLGFDVVVLDVDREGHIDQGRLEDAMNDGTLLVSIMAANNEIGTLHDIRSIAGAVHAHGAALHTDAVQAITKLPLGRSDDFDLLSMAAHKFHGPKGVGALFIRKGLKVQPIMFGGGHERGLRPSTENVPGIVGMGAAMRIGISTMDADVERMARLRERMVYAITETIPGVEVNGPRHHRLCNNANLLFPETDGQQLVLRLDKAGFAVSTGSACSTHHVGASHVLTAIGLTPRQAGGSLRISLSRFTTASEVDGLVAALPECVKASRL
ncbi:MAG: putative cysteine desulfurase 2 [Methanomassiliicoccales archaeon PtaU1.Bin124]|nr:MAG: putative cysteine desulfurase 2 [Methanomassiliicoccales archaeon PtaU1.Bin124]